MKVKQQTLKGFEFNIDDIESFKVYYIKNEPLIQGHLLILKGLVNNEIKLFLDEKKAAYIDANTSSLLMRKKRVATALMDSSLPFINKDEKVLKSNVKNRVFYRTVRSGESICVDKDLVFFGRINSGAVIESSSSIEIFGIIDGLIRCEGEYILLKEIGLGTVFFHGEELDKSQFNGQLKLIQYKDGLIMKEV